jgi:hypothetical protein
MARGNKACSKSCGHRRMRRLGARLEVCRARELSVRAELAAQLLPDGGVPLEFAVAAVMHQDAEGYLRGYDACWRAEVGRRRRRLEAAS